MNRKSQRPYRIRKELIRSSLHLFLIIFSINWISGQSSGPKEGTCMIIGGGKLDSDIYQSFANEMGGFDKKLIIIPTAGVTNQEVVDPEFTQLINRFKNQGFTEVSVLHTTDPVVANQDTFANKIREARGIWFTGGRQWRLVDAYGNTKSLEAFKHVLSLGGVIAGTSAGATIQGSFLARGDTKTNTIMMGDHQIGFGFIDQVAIDQHVLRRNRQFDLLEICQAHPNLLGIGLDENTAMIVKKDVGEVIGKSYVLIYDGTQYEAETNSFVPTENGFHLMRSGQKYHIVDRQIIH